MLNKPKLKKYLSMALLVGSLGYIVFFVATKTELFKGLVPGETPVEGSPLPDLVISAVTYPEETLKAGQYFSVNPAVTNEGRENITGNIALSLKIFDTDTSEPPVETVLFENGNYTLTNLDAGEKKSIPLATYWPMTEGDHYLEVCADSETDPEKIIAESNEDNNCFIGTVNVGADSNHPKITILNPRAQYVAAPVKITAHAADNIGVSHVAFSVDDETEPFSDTQTPFEFDLDTSGMSNNSQHRIKAEVFNIANPPDIIGAKIILTLDNTVPEVALITPAAASEIADTGTEGSHSPIEITATATDEESGISRINLLVNGMYVGQFSPPTDGEELYTYSYTPLGNGIYSLKARAYNNSLKSDGGFLSAESAEVTVQYGEAQPSNDVGTDTNATPSDTGTTSADGTAEDIPPPEPTIELTLPDLPAPAADAPFTINNPTTVLINTGSNAAKVEFITQKTGDTNTQVKYEITESVPSGTGKRFSITWNPWDQTAGRTLLTPYETADLQLLAQALDADGTALIATSALQIHADKIDTTPPSITLTKPLAGEIFTQKDEESSRVEVRARVTDNESDIGAVELFSNNSRVGTLTGTTTDPTLYETDYILTNLGNYSLTVKATNGDNLAGSSTVAIRFEPPKVNVVAGLSENQTTTVTPGTKDFISPVLISANSTINDPNTKIKGFVLQDLGDFPIDKLTNPAVFYNNVEIPETEVTITKSSVNGNISVNFIDGGYALSSPQQFSLYIKADAQEASKGKFIQYSVNPIYVEPADMKVEYETLAAGSLGEKITVGTPVVAPVCAAPKTLSGGVCACPTGTHESTAVTAYSGQACVPCSAQELANNGGFFCPQHVRQAAPAGTTTTQTSAAGTATSTTAATQASAAATQAAADAELLGFFRTCQAQKKFTYTGATDTARGRVKGMCIDCTMDVFDANNGSCPQTVAAVTAPAAKKTAAKKKVAGDPGLVASANGTESGNASRAGQNFAQTSSGGGGNAPQAARAVAAGTGGAVYTAPSPGLRGSRRLMSAPEQGQEGPGVVLYFAALPTAWLFRKLKKRN